MSGPDHCCTCRAEVGWASPICACCGRTVCLGCAEQTPLGVHCPQCQADMAAFLVDQPEEVTRVPAQVPRDGQEQLLW